MQRLAGSEEVLPISSSVSQFAESSIPREIEISVKGALLEVDFISISSYSYLVL